MIIGDARLIASSMTHTFDGKEHLLNLIDTPVCRFLSLFDSFPHVCVGTRGFFMGGVALFSCLSGSPASGDFNITQSHAPAYYWQVDASQGVQAQSISVFHIAKERGLKIIPVLNKVRTGAVTCSGCFDAAN